MVGQNATFFTISSEGFPSHELLSKVCRLVTRYKARILSVTDRDTAGLHIFHQWKRVVPDMV